VRHSQNLRKRRIAVRRERRHCLRTTNPRFKPCRTCDPQGRAPTRSLLSIPSVAVVSSMGPGDSPCSNRSAATGTSGSMTSDVACGPEPHRASRQRGLNVSVPRTPNSAVFATLVIGTPQDSRTSTSNAVAVTASSGDAVRSSADARAASCGHPQKAPVAKRGLNNVNGDDALRSRQMSPVLLVSPSASYHRH
jgi:hypothetical protein